MQEVENSSAEVVLKRFEELYNKYKYMEISLTQKKKRRVVIGVGSSTQGLPRAFAGTL